MSDKYTLQLKNFRSIRDAEIDIAPLTVVYGPNGSGKSSLIYGLLTLKNFLTDPNRNLPGLFSYPGISLGGFDEVAFKHLGDETVEVSLSISIPEWDMAKFMLGASKSGGTSAIFAEDAGFLKESSIYMTLDVPFPYHVNQLETGGFTLTWTDGDIGSTWAHLGIGWNGINVNAESIEGEGGNRIAVQFMEWVNAPMELAKETYFVPLRRGFMTPVYGITNVTPMLNSDSEVASMLANDRFLGYKVSDYTEMVADRQIHARAQIGTSSFTIDSVPRNRETPVSIVNEGFGVNQLAYMLTIALYDKAQIVLIEEPEIHLHPSMVRKLVHALADIALNNDKHFIISTHSEVFVTALLARIAKGEIGVDNVSFLLAEKENGESRFTKQKAEPNGQIQGGLESFIASEFEDIAAFLGIETETA